MTIERRKLQIFIYFRNIADIVSKPEWTTDIVTKPRLLRLIFECWVRSLDDGFSKYVDSPYLQYNIKTEGGSKLEILEEGDVCSDFLSLFDKQKFTDICFIVEDKKIHAHKSILCCKFNSN